MAATPRRLAFGVHAAAYERARPAWPDAAARWLVPDGARLVVELGAGTGKLTRAIRALGVPVLAVEPDPRMLAVLRAVGLEGVGGSAEAIPLADGEADAVVAGSCLHWFDLELALPEISRVLRPGGRFAFAWNHRDGRHRAVVRLDAAIATADGARPRWWSRDWPAEVTRSGLFADLESARFPHIHELPRGALEDHLLSYSGFAALPPVERHRVRAAVEAVLEAEPSLRDGDRLRLPFVVSAYRAVRTGQWGQTPGPGRGSQRGQTPGHGLEGHEAGGGGLERGVRDAAAGELEAGR
ncbi:MAG TPA: class I SAM-dependent methyltransferase [Gaiellaceae bacterium]|nr:class I SAM-dependent methyltransferase [Gaiellaceae bacterium]